MPKQPLSGYMLWLKETRTQLTTDNPNCKSTEIAKIAGNEWKKIDSEIKTKFDNKSKQLRAEYNIKINEYKQTEEYKEYSNKLKQYKLDLKKWSKMDDEKENINKKNIIKNNKNEKLKLPTKPKDKNAPKKGLSSYQIYCSEKRIEYNKNNENNNEKLKGKELLKKISNDWKQITNENKEIYIKKANEQKENYKKLLENYQKTENFEKYQKELNIWKQKCEELKVQFEQKQKQKQNQKKNNETSDSESDDSDDSETSDESESESDSDDDSESSDESDN